MPQHPVHKPFKCENIPSFRLRFVSGAARFTLVASLLHHQPLHHQPPTLGSLSSRNEAPHLRFRATPKGYKLAVHPTHRHVNASAVHVCGRCLTLRHLSFPPLPALRRRRRLALRNRSAGCVCGRNFNPTASQLSSTAEVVVVPSALAAEPIALPATHPVVHALWKLKPPVTPSTSTTSPAKWSPATVLLSIVRMSRAESATPPQVTNSSLKDPLPTIWRQRET